VTGVGRSAFEVARAETVRYHDTLYRSGDHPDWLLQPSSFVMRAAERLRSPSAKRRIADVGCGNGRHAIPIARLLAPAVEVLCVDLVPAAIEALEHAASSVGVRGCIVPVVADLDDVDLAVDAFDMVIGCSVIEHARDVRGLLEGIRTSVRPGGFACFVVGTDRIEIRADGQVRSALVESPMTAEDLDALMRSVFVGWDVVEQGRGKVSVKERRNVEHYRLDCTAVRALFRRRA
jgi:SAM-dependent methyltransferase